MGTTLVQGSVEFNFYELLVEVNACRATAAIVYFILGSSLGHHEGHAVRIPL